MRPSTSVAAPARRALIALLLVWTGAMLAISLLAVPALFAVDGLHRPMAFAAVRRIFTIFIHLQLGLAAILVLAAWLACPPVWVRPALAALIACLLLQAFWLLPDLALRTDRILAGETPAAGWTHGLFQASELAKLVLAPAAAWRAARP